MFTAREKALAYLSRFSRTQHQVKNYLKKKGFSAFEISEAISYLHDHHFIDDDSFAESWIQSKIRNLDGPLKIKQQLFQKGISSDTGSALLKLHYPVELQLENARALLQRKKGKSREQLIRLIASRGFPLYVIIQALKNV